MPKPRKVRRIKTKKCESKRLVLEGKGEDVVVSGEGTVEFVPPPTGDVKIGTMRVTGGAMMVMKF